MSMDVLPTCMSVYHVCVRLEEGIRSYGTGVLNSYELLCGCWVLDLGPLGEQPLLLTAEPSLRPPLRQFPICVSCCAQRHLALHNIPTTMYNLELVKK